MKYTTQQMKYTTWVIMLYISFVSDRTASKQSDLVDLFGSSDQYARHSWSKEAHPPESNRKIHGYIDWY